MAKTKEELIILKTEYEELNNKLKELSEDELKQVIGGTHGPIYPGSGSMIHAPTFDESISEGDINPSSTKGWFSSPIK